MQRRALEKATLEQEPKLAVLCGVEEQGMEVVLCNGKWIDGETGRERRR